MFRASVPETAIHEYSDTSRPEDDIDLAPDPADHLAVKAESQAEAVKLGP